MHRIPVEDLPGVAGRKPPRELPPPSARAQRPWFLTREAFERATSELRDALEEVRAALEVRRAELEALRGELAELRAQVAEFGA